MAFINRKNILSSTIMMTMILSFFIFQNCAKTGFEALPKPQLSSSSLSRIINGIKASAGDKDLLTTVVRIEYKQWNVIPKLVITKNIGNAEPGIEYLDLKIFLDKMNAYIDLATTTGPNNFKKFPMYYIWANGSICSGTLYNQNTVITAGHCISTMEMRRAEIIQFFNNYSKPFLSQFIAEFKNKVSACQSFDTNCEYYNYFANISSIDLFKDKDNSTIAGKPILNYADVTQPWIQLNPETSIYDQNNNLNSQSLEVQATQLFRHPSYNENARWSHDLGVIKLPTNNKITSRNDIHYVEKTTDIQLNKENLANQIVNLKQDKWYAAGYGILSFDETDTSKFNSNGTLNYAELTSPIDFTNLTNLKDASNQIRLYYEFNSFLDSIFDLPTNLDLQFNANQSLIFKVQTEKSSAVFHGDSGGPMYYYKTNTDGTKHFVQLAVNSWGNVTSVQDSVGSLFLGWILNENDWSWINDPEHFTENNLIKDSFDTQFTNKNIQNKCSYFFNESPENRIQFNNQFSITTFLNVFQKTIYARKNHTLILDLNTFTGDTYNSFINNFSNTDTVFPLQIEIEKTAILNLYADQFKIPDTMNSFLLLVYLNYEKQDVDFTVQGSNLILNNNKTHSLIASIALPNSNNFESFLELHYLKPFDTDESGKPLNTEIYSKSGQVIIKQNLDYSQPCVIKSCADTNADPIACNTNKNTAGSCQSPVYLSEGGDFESHCNNIRVVGPKSGNATLIIKNGISGVISDANIKTFQLSGNRYDYLIRVNANPNTTRDLGLLIFNKDHTSQILNILSLNYDSKIKFSDGSVVNINQFGFNYFAMDKVSVPSIEW